MAPNENVRPISNGTSVQDALHRARLESNLSSYSIQALLMTGSSSSLIFDASGLEKVAFFFWFDHLGELPEWIFFG
jgi:hypothetical protein